MIEDYIKIDKALEVGDFATASKLIVSIQEAMMLIINSDEVPAGIFKDMMVENYNFLDQYLLSINTITIDN